MTSKKKTIQKLVGPSQLQKSPSDPKQPSHKFLLRTFTISNKDDAAYRFVRVKRFYLKRLVVDFLNRQLYKTDYKFVSEVLKNSKTLKTLKRAHITSDLKPHVHESLKHSKNLKKYNIGFKTDDDETKKIQIYLKNLSLQVEMIRINIFRLSFMDNNDDLYNNAKAIRRFRHLKYFNRWYFSHTFDPEREEGERSHVSNELQTLSDSVSRLKEMKKITFHTNYSEQRGLQRAMRRGFVYPGITGLRIDLDGPQFTHFYRMEEFFAEEKETERIYEYEDDPSLSWENMSRYQKQIYRSVIENIKKEDLRMEDDLRKTPKSITKEEEFDWKAKFQEIDDRDDEVFAARCRMKEDIKPFFRYELFPDLKKLSFKQRTFLYPLGPFVVDGFKALNKLESFKFKIASRSFGTKYVFEGLKHLPLLKKFSLTINFLRDKEWDLLENFLEGQVNLECLSLTIKADYFIKHRFLRQNAALEKIMQDLNNKPKLKIIELRSPYWSLQSLSNGLAHVVKLTNQIQTFEFQGSDDIIDSEERVWKRVQGLCQFIKNQKKSLQEVSLELGIALEDNLVNHIMEALSKLVNLRNLHLDINSGFIHAGGIFISYFKMAHSNKSKSVPAEKNPTPEIWSPSLAKYLKKLHSLENLKLSLGIINPNKQDSGKWIVEAIKALPSLERLKYLDIAVDENQVLKREEPKIITALRELKNIKEMRIDLYGDYGEYSFDESKIKEIVLEVNRKQAVRSDLMF